jgi:ferredoxin-NADP reductase/ferredoxin
VQVRFEDRNLEVLSGETVLECIERHGLTLPSFCRNGICQSCLVKATSGQVPASAQVGLKTAWKQQGYFLACLCRPVENLDIAPCNRARAFASRVVRTEQWAPGIFGVWLERPAGFCFRAGQFVHVIRPGDGLVRAYSLASTSDEASLELHVAVLANGRMSGWLTEATGAQVEIRGPFGECFYSPGRPDEPIVLAGTGTGLAPLLGVLRSALAARHAGPIRFYHGARNGRGLYRCALLAELDQHHENLTVTHSVLEPDAPRADGALWTDRPVEEVLFADIPTVIGWRAYLCGSAAFVRSLKKKLYLAGVSLEDIHSDPFVQAPPTPSASR